MSCLTESTLQEFLEGTLAEEPFTHVQSHLHLCAHCRMTIAQIPSGPASAPAEDRLATRGGTVGRYTLLGRIGGGAMSTVYAAYDPRLDRRVALKLLRTEAVAASAGAGAQVRGRLLEQAQRLRALSHPNIVATLDAGTSGDRVFLVMELLTGQTLGAWLAAKPRATGEVVTRLRAAGQGLAAAHAAGILHHDFKPENVFVCDDGRVLVTDFSLSGPQVATFAGDAQRRAPAGRAFPLTETGLLLGTPAYMAPELLQGAPADARSDQFSFCVSLFEALYGQRPFAGDTLDALASAIAQGRIDLPKGPAAARVPTWLRWVVLRGLSQDRAARYPSLAALLDDVSRDPARHRRLRTAGVAGAALCLVALLSWGRHRHERAASCRSAAQSITSTWNAERRQALRRAFLATGRPFAEDASNAVSAALDQLAGAWTQARRETCEATRLRGERPEAGYALAEHCFAERAQELDALVGVLSLPDASTVEGGLEATARAYDVRSCRDVHGLAATSDHSADPAAERDVPALRSQLAQVKALHDTGKLADGLALAQLLVARARGLGDRGTLAEALYLAGALQAELRHDDGAEKLLSEAGWIAEAVHEDALAARCWLALLHFVAYEEHRHDLGQYLGQQARAAIDRTGGDRLLEAELLFTTGRILADERRLDDAIDLQKRALAIRESLLGPSHPKVAQTVHELGADAALAGRYDEALALERRVLALREQSLGPVHPQTAAALASVGSVLVRENKLDEATKDLRRALEITERAFGANHASLPRLLHELSTVEFQLGQRAEALAHSRRALAISERVLGPAHAEVGTSLTFVAAILSALDRHDEAIATYRRAIDVLQKAQGPDHADLAMVLAGLGHEYVTRNDTVDALAVLERSLEIAEKAKMSPSSIAEIRFALAEVLWDAKKDRPRALQLMRQAQSAFAKAQDAPRAEVAQVDSWLKSHAAGPRSGVRGR